jgi:adenylate cyclase class 2
MAIEVEQKFRIADRPALVARLTALGCRCDPPIEQVDHYFAHPGRDFAQTDEALRLRQMGPLNYITYKGPKLDALTKTRHEIEISLAAGPQAAADTQQLLTALGFALVRAVRKQRAHATATWQGRQIGVALDTVGALGEFVELEIVAEIDTVAEARKAIAALADHLGLSGSERRSYLELLLALEA